VQKSITNKILPAVMTLKPRLGNPKKKVNVLLSVSLKTPTNA
jgi:hypothetical protein